MLQAIPQLLRFLRARWRWRRGRCPRCNRNLYAAFPYYMANDPNCPVCKDETATDLRLWRKHTTLMAANRAGATGAHRRTRTWESATPRRSTAIAFDLDAASLRTLQEALPEWEIEVVIGATADALAHDWNPGGVDLLVVTARADVAETLALCRFLVACDRFATDSRAEVEASRRHANRQTQARRAAAPLLVLVPPGQERLVNAALEAGADSCLVLPVHAKEVASMSARGRKGNQPGRHTLALDRAQTEDCWQDDGGQG